MESISIPDPSRLRINFGGASRGKVAWPTVEPLEAARECKECEEVMLDISSVIGRKAEAAPPPKRTGLQVEVPSWVMSLGYALFGVFFALASILHVEFPGRVCVIACPLPVVCLLLQAAASPWLPGLALLVCAALLPALCVLETPFWAVGAVGLLLSIGTLARCQKRSVLVYASFAGAVLSLGLPLLEASLGLTTAAFFLCVLCVVSCERTHIKVWI
jgi:hypothetical protein